MFSHQCLSAGEEVVDEQHRLVSESLRKDGQDRIGSIMLVKWEVVALCTYFRSKNLS